MTRLFLGIDGGGTKTQAIIVDEHGRFQSTGLGGPSNYDDVGVPATQASVDQAVTAARQVAHLTDAPFTAVFLGMAGVVSATDRAIITQIARNLNLAPSEAIGVDHDCRIALAGGLSGRPGMVQIAGTGSSTFGINAAGESWRAGGWGQLIADEGSGYWLGVQALQAAVRAYDGRLPHTLLLDLVKEHLDITDMNDIMHRLYSDGIARSEIAALSPLVIATAQAGDHTACNLLQQGASLLADCVVAVANKLGFANGPSELALVGGMFKAGVVFERPFQEAVIAQLPHCQLVPAELPPVLGAAVLALQSSGITINQTISQQLHHAAEQIA